MQLYNHILSSLYKKTWFKRLHFGEYYNKNETRTELQ